MDDDRADTDRVLRGAAPGLGGAPRSAEAAPSSSGGGASDLASGAPPGANGAVSRAGSGAPPRIGGIALRNGLIVVSERHWAAAIREPDGGIKVASGKKVPLARPGAWSGVPVARGLLRFAETLVVLGMAKAKLPNAELPIEGNRVAAALAVSLAASSVVRAAARRSPVAAEIGTALAAVVPAVLAVRGSAVSGYHGAEHKVIGAWEAAWRAGLRGPEALRRGVMQEATKEHERCGSNIVGPYLVAGVAANLLARTSLGRRSRLASAVASAASLGVALEAVRWANTHADSLLARLLLAPGRLIQKRFTTSEPTPEQLEVGRRALEELLALEKLL
ncbi:MAG: DUF1385 domain-containing protein [Thermoleophilia bacterium]|nr:DUF1385 domain-containing protein [Thermoleophilia bacterium]